MLLPPLRLLVSPLLVLPPLLGVLLPPLQLLVSLLLLALLLLLVLRATCRVPGWRQLSWCSLLGLKTQCVMATPFRAGHNSSNLVQKSIRASSSSSPRPTTSSKQGDTHSHTSGPLSLWQA